MSAFVSQLLIDHLGVVKDLSAMSEEIARLGEILVSRLRAGQRILLCGNGGSAADAQHISTELVCRFETARLGLPAIALTTDTSALTAIGNDFGFERIFARQVEALGRPGDVLIAISTSGNSANVLAAVEAAKSLGMASIGLLGSGGGRLGSCVDYALVVPSDVTARVQECHILVGHVWCAMVDKAFS
ncbi:MAG TPA: SIS domain-containing protein [Rhodocyclaceae bacterium]|nr:SIS domain-containing protein [Rhodocyclaceae bacterium]